MQPTTSYKTLQQNSIKYMLHYVEEYEAVRAKKHPKFQYVRDFFKAKEICFQNFYKFYSRYCSSGRNPEALLPTRRGPKPKYREILLSDESLDAQILSYRQKGFNKYLVSAALKKQFPGKKGCSPSAVYRILRLYGASRLTKALKEEKNKIVREKVGLAHIDGHCLPKGIVRADPLKRYYVLGVIDDYSRIVWAEVMASTKSIDATFAMMDAILVLNQRYDVTFEEAMTDNGSEFCGGQKSLETHPFERLLMHFGIKHLRTKPYRPQTNGKIERFWRSFEEEVIEGSVFETLDDLKDAVVGYNFYYNEQRPHQGIGGKTPLEMLSKKE